MDVEARMARLEKALWREHGRTQVLGHMVIGLLGNLQNRDSKDFARIIDVAREEAEKIRPSEGPVFEAMRAGAKEAQDTIEAAFAKT